MTARAMAAVSGVAVFLGGCAGPSHLTPAHGRATRAAITAQRASPVPAAAPDVSGLDSQEAAIISAAYRRSLAPKGVNVEEEQVILLSKEPPPARALPPPSVPK